MDISIDWLNAYFGPSDEPISPEDAGRVLTELGFPVEGTTPLPDGDMCIDFELTSNRGDCACHVGFAREVAAATGRTLTLPEVPENTTGDAAADHATIEIEDLEGCPRYTGWVIRDVTIGPSPDWLVKRLESIGQRSINNAVDVTNFVLHELGQPTHVFDMNKLAKRDGKPAIIVRESKASEELTTLDGDHHKLPKRTLIIADAERPVALAGVMGGQDTEVDETTTDILLEAATFHPLAVRIAARKLKISTDSSYRFERIVEPRTIEYAARRCAQLIAELCGGTLLAGHIAAGRELPESAQVSMRCDRCNALLGLDISPEQQVAYLQGLQLEPVLADGVITCTIPMHRTDLEREVDLIEEVARVHGFDNIPVHERLEVSIHAPQPTEQAKGRLREILTGLGYFETTTFSFVSKQDANAFLPGEAKLLKVDDDRRKAEPYLRPSILPSLLHCRQVNQNAGASDVRLFEMSATFMRRGEAVDERPRLAVVRDAAQADEAVRDIRIGLETIVRDLCGHDATLSVEPATPDFPGLDPDASGRVLVNGETIGWLGLVSSASQQEFGLDERVMVFEVEVGPLLSAYPAPLKIEPLPQFPHIERDLSLIVDEPVAWATIDETIGSLTLDHLEDYEYVTTFRGKQIGAGRKSVTLRLRFRDPEGTLRHEQVDPQVERIVTALGESVAAELRA
jgi:phenylalanyl-tRNA synthetase beta chain